MAFSRKREKGVVLHAVENVEEVQKKFKESGYTCEIHHINPNSGNGAKEMSKRNVILAKNAILTKEKKVTDDCPQHYKFFQASCSIKSLSFRYFLS